MGSRHSILRQRIELQCEDASSARILVDRLQAHYDAWILEPLAEALDEFDVAGMEIELDRLEIDLGELGGEVLAEELPRRIKAALRQAWPVAGISPAGLGLQRRSSSEGKWQRLQDFLERGCGPWWVAEQDFRPWEELLAWIAEQPGSMVQYLRSLSIGEVERVMARVAGAGEVRVSNAVLELLLGESEAAAVLAQLNHNHRGKGTWTAWQLRSLTLLAAVRYESGGASVLKQLAMSLAESDLEESMGRWRSELGSNRVVSPLPARAASVLQEQYVDNCGLVLVAAFLPALFGELGLLEGQGWRDSEAQMRGLRMTIVLTHGAAGVDEHRLGLHKLICGLPLDAEVDLGEAASEEALKAAHDLLEAVIGYWTVLGNVSPDQVRGTFLQREGWLRRGSADWHLRVERKAYDVVLERLPWAIGVVALPWLDYKVWVEW